jgi:hypothetical protein
MGQVQEELWLDQCLKQVAVTILQSELLQVENVLQVFLCASPVVRHNCIKRSNKCVFMSIQTSMSKLTDEVTASGTPASSLILQPEETNVILILKYIGMDTFVLRLDDFIVQKIGQ